MATIASVAVEPTIGKYHRLSSVTDYWKLLLFQPGYFSGYYRNLW